jgi:acyl-CoA thioesterase-1
MSERRRPGLLLFGDSISAGWGVEASAGLEALMNARLRAAGLALECREAGVPGGTAAQGRRRTGRWLAQAPAVVVLQFGGNDVFQGRSEADLSEDLIALAQEFTRAGSRAVIAGTLFPGLPDGMRNALSGAYRRAAAVSGSRLVADLFAGWSGARDCFQGDGIHPNAEGYRRMAEVLWGELGELLIATASPADGTDRGPG